MKKRQRTWDVQEVVDLTHEDKDMSFDALMSLENNRVENKEKNDDSSEIAPEIWTGNASIASADMNNSHDSVNNAHSLFTALAKEIILLILSYSGYPSIISVRLTNRILKSIIDDAPELFWISLFVSHGWDPSAFLNEKLYIECDKSWQKTFKTKFSQRKWKCEAKGIAEIEGKWASFMPQNRNSTMIKLVVHSQGKLKSYLIDRNNSNRSRKNLVPPILLDEITIDETVPCVEIYPELASSSIPLDASEMSTNFKIEPSFSFPLLEESATLAAYAHCFRHAKVLPDCLINAYNALLGVTNEGMFLFPFNPETGQFSTKYPIFIHSSIKLLYGSIITNHAKYQYAQPGISGTEIRNESKRSDNRLGSSSSSMDSFSTDPIYFEEGDVFVQHQVKETLDDSQIPSNLHQLLCPFKVLIDPQNHLVVVNMLHRIRIWVNVVNQLEKIVSRSRKRSEQSPAFPPCLDNLEFQEIKVFDILIQPSQLNPESPIDNVFASCIVQSNYLIATTSRGLIHVYDLEKILKNVMESSDNTHPVPVLSVDLNEMLCEHGTKTGATSSYPQIPASIYSQTSVNQLLANSGQMLLSPKEILGMIESDKPGRFVVAMKPILPASSPSSSISRISSKKSLQKQSQHAVFVLLNIVPSNYGRSNCQEQIQVNTSNSNSTSPSSSFDNYSQLKCVIERYWIDSTPSGDFAIVLNHVTIPSGFLQPREKSMQPNQKQQEQQQYQEQNDYRHQYQQEGKYGARTIDSVMPLSPITCSSLLLASNCGSHILRSWALPTAFPLESTSAYSRILEYGAVNVKEMGVARAHVAAVGACFPSSQPAPPYFFASKLHYEHPYYVKSTDLISSAASSDFQIGSTWSVGFSSSLSKKLVPSRPLHFASFSKDYQRSLNQQLSSKFPEASLPEEPLPQVLPRSALRPDRCAFVPFMALSHTLGHLRRAPSHARLSSYSSCSTIVVSSSSCVSLVDLVSKQTLWRRSNCHLEDTFDDILIVGTESGGHGDTHALAIFSMEPSKPLSLSFQ